MGIEQPGAATVVRRLAREERKRMALDLVCVGV